ncbi:YheC/YheD family protein [Aquibacillus rhizosphaerae]|uniref:YheC/YheD family protein n=1 Tax=Aquibacillus rhizosphaerae TaxID=3051431 RepID=A0ABT7LBG4_9BACI|nr:YheC/YheD family protein [Aquibacillus sp. LR5S19]MDL4843204.1 YheC/YheD family protein [Aquibacillus sp. LR5S19]
MDNHSYNHSGVMRVHFDKERLYFNKWEMYKLLAPYKFPFHIPYTNYLTSQSVDLFANNRASFFIKPVDTWSGKYISLVTPNAQGFILQHPNGTEELLPTKEVLQQRVVHQYSNTHAIIQKQAPLLPFENRAFDIRVHLQRDKNGYWLYAGDLIRMGGENAIVSNLFSKGGGVIETDIVLQHLFNSYHVKAVKANLVKSAFAIANLLDYHYLFADIGADFGVDQYGNLWLLEVNTNDRNGRPDYKLFKKLPNKNIYKQMVSVDKARM